MWRVLCALIAAFALGIYGYSRFGRAGLLGGAVSGLVVGWIFGRFVGPEDVLT